MFYVYIMKSRVQQYHYVGLTRNLERRIAEHRKGQSAVTKAYRPFDLAWYCSFTNRFRAAEFERYLKSGSGRAFTSKHLLE